MTTSDLLILLLVTNIVWAFVCAFVFYYGREAKRILNVEVDAWKENYKQECAQATQARAAYNSMASSIVNLRRKLAVEQQNRQSYQREIANLKNRIQNPGTKREWLPERAKYMKYPQPVALANGTRGLFDPPIPDRVADPICGAIHRGLRSGDVAGFEFAIAGLQAEYSKNVHSIDPNTGKGIATPTVCRPTALAADLVKELQALIELEKQEAALLPPDEQKS